MACELFRAKAEKCPQLVNNDSRAEQRSAPQAKEQGVAKLSKPALKVENMLLYLGIPVDTEIAPVLAELMKHSRVNENDMAEKIDTKVNNVRKVMYRLSARGYVSYTRERNKEKKWWYIYFWKFNKVRLIEDYLARKRAELTFKQELMERERAYTFRCKSGCAKLKYEDALEQGFMCPECGCEIIEIKRYAEASNLEREISGLQKDVENIERLRSK